MAFFEKAHKITALIEGGYVNDPDDPGGETYKGISRKHHPNWRGWEIIDSFKAYKTLKHGDYISSFKLDEYVNDLYKELYWDINKLDNINDQEIANELFDTGVNMGTGTAAEILQEALNLLNYSEETYKLLKVDGKLGFKTLEQTNWYCNRHPKALLKTLNGLQFERYVEICRKNPSKKKFFRGWLLRV